MSNHPILRFLAVLIAPALFAVPAFADEENNQSDWGDVGQTIVVVPESREVVAAYSKKLGLWAFAKLDEPLPASESQAAVGGQVAMGERLAVFQAESTFYAYSADTGKWKRLELDEKTTPTARFHVAGDVVRVITDEVLYVFAANAGDWTGINLVTGMPQAPAG